MKSIISYIIILFCFFSNIFAQKDTPILLQQGIRHNQEGKYTDAIESFTSIITENPSKFPEVYRHRGYSYYYSKKYDLAINDFKKAQSLAPGKTDASFALGKIYYIKGNYKLALEYFDTELAFNPDNSKAYNDRGIVKCQIRKYDSAIVDFTNAFHLDSTFAMAFNNAGAAKYYNQDIDNPIEKDIESAKEYFSKAIELDPTLAIAYRNRGAMNLFLDEYEDALFDFKIAEKFQPNVAVIPFYNGIVLEEMGKPMSAINELKRAIGIDKNFPFSYEEIADIHYKKEQYNDALLYYQKAIKHALSMPDIYKGLIHYKISKVNAKQMEKSKMYLNLQAAKRYGAFSDKKVYQKFLANSEFKKYRSEKKMKKFTKSINKIKKEYKFLHSELRWFRMND